MACEAEGSTDQSPLLAEEEITKKGGMFQLHWGGLQDVQLFGDAVCQQRNGLRVLD